jgi:protein-S-isoprenylcysteine O-methyltransferase Ste14
MPVYAYIVVAAGTILWCAPFVLALTERRNAFQIDRRARWGVALECVAYSLLWQGRFWERSPEWWRLAFSVSFFLLACALSWTGARALGRHLRIDAALDPTHELVRSGPYLLVRHPIYTSMLCVLLGTGVLISPFYLLLLAAPLFLIGTEIRMRVEDRMLASRFGDGFREYQRDVPPLVPLLKLHRLL